MKITITKNRKEAVKKATSIIYNEIKKKPDLNLGLATGSTMIPLFKNLVSLFKNKKISFEKVKTFNLDEYIGLPKENKNSYKYYMNKYLFNKVNIKRENIHFPKINSKIKYEEEIKKAKGIDLQILGIGENGHIGFNEPGSKFNTITRVIKLSDSTRKNNSKNFSLLSLVPKYAVTMGIKTIMNSKKIILIAVGKNKSEAIYNTLNLKVTTKVPASVLNKHKCAIFILDKSAASKL